MKNVAVIPAGGSGKRINSPLPKQYLPVGDCPLLVHTLRIFELSPIIQDILLVVPKDDVSDVEALMVRSHGLKKVSRVLAGGAQRQDSVKNGLALVGDETDIVLIHDGVRPFVTGNLIELAVREARRHGAAAVGVPVRETVKRVDGDGWIVETLDREALWLAQTPQAFRRTILQEAHQRAFRDRFYGTDDASLVERMGHPVKMIAAGYDNLKITTQADLDLAEVLMEMRKATAS